MDKADNELCYNGGDKILIVKIMKDRRKKLRANEEPKQNRN